MAMTGGTAVLVKSEYANYGSSSVKINLYVYYRTAQNVANNQSTITVGMYVSVPSTYTIGPWSAYETSYIGTTAITFDGAIPSMSGTRWLVENKTFTVNHNSDGTGTATIYWKWGVNSPWGQYIKPSGSFTITLPTIPRASSISAAGNVTLGNRCNIQWVPASTSFYYQLYLKCGSKQVSMGVIHPATTSTYTYTGYIMTVADWAPQITTSKTATCTATLYTYSDSACSNQIGSATTKTFTLTVPDSVKPTIGTFTATISGDSFSSTNGIYVQGKAKALLAMSGCSSPYGGSITNYYITGDYSYSSTTWPSGNPPTVTLTSSGSKTFYAQVRDSRGIYSDKKAVTINVVAYSQPTITISASRIANTTSVSIGYDIGYAKIGTNQLGALTIYKKLSTASTWTSCHTATLGTTTSGAITLTGFEATSSYNFYATIVDTAYSSVGTSNIDSIGTDFRLINIDVDNNVVSFGKLAEGTNQFECAIPATFSKNVNIEGTLTANVAYTASECADYTVDGTTKGCSPAAVKRAVGLFNPKAHTHSEYAPNANYAVRGTYNNLIHSTNEFTCVSPQFSGALWMNYRTSSGNQDGNISIYYFGNGKGAVAGGAFSSLYENGTALSSKYAKYARRVLNSTALSNNGTVQFTTDDTYSAFIVYSYIASTGRFFSSIVTRSMLGAELAVDGGADYWNFTLSISGNTVTLKRGGTTAVSYIVDEI